VTIRLPRNSGDDQAHHQPAMLPLTMLVAPEAQADNVTDVAPVALPRVHLCLNLNNMTRLIPVVAPVVAFLATVILVLLRRLSHLPELVVPENIHREMAVMLQTLPVATGELESFRSPTFTATNLFCAHICPKSYTLLVLAYVFYWVPKTF